MQFRVIVRRGICVLLLACATAAKADETASLWGQDTLTGDWGGLRTRLTDHGIAVSIADIEELLGDSAGGLRRGTGYDGYSALSVQADLDTLADWRGATIELDAGELRGHGLSQHDVGNILTVSNIEAQPETRLFDFYLEQNLFDGRLSIRAGQISPSDEFITSHYGAAFMNSTFGWPAIAGADLPGEDPTDLLATPGIRVKMTTPGGFSWQTGLFKGASNSSNGPPETQDTTSSGDGGLVLTELALSVAGTEDGTLPAAYKLGAWYHSGTFDDLRVDQFGLPLAIPHPAVPRAHHGDLGAYAVVDRMIWNTPDTPDGGLGVFARISGARGDRNLVSIYADAGLTFKGALPHRGSDVAGIAFGWAGIGGSAQGFDRDVRSIYGVPYPVRDHEAVVELTYQFVAAPWWTIQPDVQYVLHPGAHGPNPEAAAGFAPIPDALVFGLRTIIRF